MTYYTEKFKEIMKLLFINSYNEIRIWVKILLLIGIEFGLVYLCNLGNIHTIGIVGLSFLTVGIGSVFLLFDHDVIWGLGFTICLFISAILLTNALTNSYKIKHEQYDPTAVVQTQTQTILEYGSLTLRSTDVVIYKSVHPKICKDMKWNGFNLRLSDKWYVCGE